MRRILCACLVLACVFGVGAENVNGRVIAAKPEMVRTAVAARALIPTLKASPAKAAIIAEDEAIEWSEEATSLTAQGVRTLKGYRGGRMCAVVSEYGGKVAGWLDSDSHRKTFQVRTSADGLLTLTAEDAAARHVDDVSLDDEVPFSPDRRYAPVMRGAAANGKISAMTNQPLTRNDGVVRHYRAVFPVSNYIYRYNYYSDPEAVFANWASLEAFLNELYMPALGIHFTVIADERLIDKDDTFGIDNMLYSKACQRSKELVPTLIDVNSYDCGLTLCIPSEASGACSLSAYLNHSGKTAGVCVDSYLYIAHEMGHGFGAGHTFAGSVGIMSNFVEPGAGQSLMSYGTPQDFFSMVSIYEIQHMIVDRLKYYTDESRTVTAGSNEGQTSNYPVGYPSANRAPQIDTLATYLRPSYTIPNNTNFGINFVATDPDGDAMTYFIQGADYQTDSYHPVSPVHPTYQGVQTPFVGFQPRYTYSWFDRKFVQTEYSGMQVTPGTYHYWAGVSDEQPASDSWQTAPHATAYDLYEFAITVVDGTPFRITSKTADSYSFGDRVQLRWGVDPAVFNAESRVRILLSDDFGRTYKWVLRESAPNNGSCEVILPHEAVGMTSYDGSKTFRGGVIKVEEIGGICYAVTHESPVYDGENYQMMTGGFTLTQGSIVFANTPERYVRVASDAIPAAPAVTASAGGTALAVSLNETWQSPWVLSRVWTATSGTKTASFEQIVVLDDKAATEVSRIELDKTELELVQGKTARISATVYPLEITNRRVSWASSNTAVATIDNDGIITGVGEGQCTITASTANGTTATCALSVLDDSDYRPGKYAALGFTTPGAGFRIDVENVEAGRTFNAFAFGICNTGDKPFAGYIGVAIVSAQGKLKSVLAERYTYLAGNDFGYPDFTNLSTYGVTIDPTDEVRIVARSSDETAWRPLPSREGFPAMAPVRGNVIATSNIVYDLHPASMTASGYCYNTSQKLPVLGSQYVFTIAGFPSGAKVRYYVDGEETLYRSIQPVWKDSHTVKVLALTDADMIDDAYVFVETPGTLGALLEESDYDLYFVRSLRVVGNINGADLEFIKDQRLSNLEHLDLYDTSIIESSYGGNNEMHARALSGTGLTTLALPKGLTSLGNGALSRTALTEIDIPASLEYFSLNVFNSSSALVKVVMRNPDPLPINWCVFEGTGRSFGTLYVPKGRKSAFANADQWGQWANIVEVEDMAALPVSGRLAATGSDDDDKSGATVSIENATTDANAIYYRLDGTRVPATSLTPGFYIRKTPSSATKLLIK
ncbi:MAG: Ig-like domain-containing protein [Muribaculaceae bacterium]|mgnify:CR=1 FL=1|nr:Ig-like domain-containing protein [Muribaculaceae bacterium]